MDPEDPFVIVVIMHEHGICKDVEHGMNKNCPLTKIDLEMGFVNLNRCK